MYSTTKVQSRRRVERLMYILAFHLLKMYHYPQVNSLKIALMRKRYDHALVNPYHADDFLH